MSIDLELLNEKELDFYKFSINNLDKFISLSIKSIAETFGCGISFIYNYFEKIKVKGLKNYIEILIKEVKVKNNLFDELKIDSKELKLNEYKLIDYFFWEIQEIEKIFLQEKKIENIKNMLYNSEKIYGIAFGHSRLAMKDFFGYWNYLKKNSEIINYDKNENIKNYIQKNSLVIIYSIRFINKKYTKIISDLKKISGVKILLITSNTSKDLKNQVNEIFYINNVMKMQENFDSNLYFSPLNSFILFNNFLKAEIFKDNKNFLLSSKDFKKEINGWTFYKDAKDI